MITKRSLLQTCLLGAVLLMLPLAASAQFTFTTNGNGSLNISAYTGSDANVIIPDMTNGLTVTSIGINAFLRNTNLNNVTIGKNVTTIGNTVFAYCSNLYSVTIPNGVTKIGQGLCQNCTSLTNATLGTNLTSIGNNAFSGCVNLPAITVDTNNPSYCSIDGVLFNKSQTSLIQFPEGKAGAYTVPTNVTSISPFAFSNCVNLTSIMISTNYPFMLNYMFQNCIKLTNVSIPTNTTGQGSYSFQYCTSLTNFTIPYSLGIGSHMFSGCSNLTSIVIPYGQFIMGSGAFQYCSRLNNVTIPDSVESIDDFVFYGCSSLTTVTIPSSVESVGMEAFYGCTNLISVTFSSSTSIGNPLGSFTFAGCPYLTSVYIQGNNTFPSDSTMFSGDNSATVYYLLGTANWGVLFDGRPTAFWWPQIQISDGSLGVQTNQFGFNIYWASGMTVVVEACTDLSNPAWVPVGTNNLTGALSYFCDPNWTNYPARFYRTSLP